MGLSHSFKRLLYNLSVALRFPNINVTVCSTFMSLKNCYFCGIRCSAVCVSVCKKKRAERKKKRVEFSESTKEQGLVTENGNLHVTR